MTVADPRVALTSLDALLATLDGADLVPPPRPRLRRSRRHLQLLLSHLGGGRLLATCSALPAAWTITMIAIALAVRY